MKAISITSKIKIFYTGHKNNGGRMKSNKWFSILAIFLFVVSIYGATPQVAFAADSDIVLSEIVVFPACTVAINGCASTTQSNYEWVEIHNKGTEPVDILNWKICDNNPGSNHSNCDTLASVSTEIPAGGYWVIANSNVDPTYYLQEEFNFYSATVDATRTIYLGQSIGSNGINEVADAIFIITDEQTCGTGTAPCVADCVSWDGINTCASLVNGTSRAYLTGSNGYDDSTITSAPPPGILPGQSIANIAGVWYQHGPIENVDNQASPYAINIEENGPTAISLNQFSANNNSSLLTISVSALLLLAFTGLLAFYQKRKNAS